MLNAEKLRQEVRGWSDDDLRAWLLGGLRSLCEPGEGGAVHALAPLVLTAAEPWSWQIHTAVRALDGRDGERVRSVLGQALSHTTSTFDPPALLIELWRLAILIHPPGDLVASARNVLVRMRHTLDGEAEGRRLIDAVFAAIRTRPHDERVASFFRERRYAVGWRAMHARAYVLYATRHEPGQWHVPVADFADEIAEGLNGRERRRAFAQRVLDVVPLALIVGRLAFISAHVDWLYSALMEGASPLIRTELRRGRMFAISGLEKVPYPITANDNSVAFHDQMLGDLIDENRFVSAEVLTILTAEIATPAQTDQRASRANDVLTAFLVAR